MLESGCLLSASMLQKYMDERASDENSGEHPQCDALPHETSYEIERTHKASQS
jgi:hypothetical protein